MTHKEGPTVLAHDIKKIDGAHTYARMAVNGMPNAGDMAYVDTEDVRCDVARCNYLVVYSP